jgi:hypothetical protein
VLDMSGTAVSALVRNVDSALAMAKAATLALN